MPSNSNQALQFAQWLEQLDRYGGDLSDWPEDQQGAARQLLAQSEAARDALRQTQEIEAALRVAAVNHRAPAGVARRILTATQPSPAPQGWLSHWLNQALWRPALAGALTLLLGGALGWSAPAEPNDIELNAAGIYPWLLEDAELLALEQLTEELTDE